MRNTTLFLIQLSCCTSGFAMQLGTPLEMLETPIINNSDSPKELLQAQAKMQSLGIPIKELEKYIRLQNDIDILELRMYHKVALQKEASKSIPLVNDHTAEIAAYRALYNRSYGYALPLKR